MAIRQLVAVILEVLTPLVGRRISRMIVTVLLFVVILTINLMEARLLCGITAEIPGCQPGTPVK